MPEDNYTKILSEYRDKAIEIIRSIDYSASGGAPGILITVGDGKIDSVRQVLDSTAPQTMVLYYIQEDFRIESLSQAFSSRNVLFSSLSEDAYYSDKAGILTALSPNRKVVFSIPSEIEKRIPEKLDRIHEAVRDALSNAAQSNAERLIYLRHSIFNLKKILSSPEIKLNASGKKTSAIVCGAGPSLKDQLETLKKYQSNFYVFCVGRVASTLIEAGIMPDLMFQTDPHVLFNAEWIKKIPEGLCPPLAAAISAYPPAEDSCFDRILWFYGDSFSVNNFLKENNCEVSDIAVSRTVMVSAIDFAVKAGCENIALLGSDLCVSGSGKYHADDIQNAENNYAGIKEIAGNRGIKVMTIPELAELKRALEKYLASQNLERIEINNCTERGAEIIGAPFMTLEEFCERHSTVEKGRIISEKRRVAPPRFSIEEILERLEKYAFILSALVKAASKLHDELSKTSPDFEKAAEMQEELRKHRQIESGLRQSPFIGFVISPVEEQISEILNELPGIGDVNQISPTVQLSLLVKRYSFIMDFCSDIASDLRSSNAYEVNALRKFKSFENYAVSFIARNNQEFAEFLKLNRACSYSFVCLGQYLPFVIVNPDGSTFFKKDSYSFEFEPKECATRFIKENSFDSNSMAVVFPAPGNWGHVVEFAKICPDADIIVLEPWLEMFAGIIQSCMFMHRLPEKTLVLGVDEKLSGWRELFASKLNELKNSGKKIIFYETPETCSKEEAVKLKKELKTICKI